MTRVQVEVWMDWMKHMTRSKGRSEGGKNEPEEEATVFKVTEARQPVD